MDLTTARTEFEAEVIVQALGAQGIPAKAFSTAGAVLQWDIASTQPIRVVVRRRDLEAARAALRAIRAESVDLDWTEVVDADEPPLGIDEQGRCRTCGYDLSGLSAVERCPECGTDVHQDPPQFTGRTPHGRRASPRSAWVIGIIILLAFLMLMARSVFGS